MQTDFTRRLKKWRGKMFQRDAAKKLGVPMRTYQNWECGWNRPDPMKEQVIFLKLK